MSDFLWALSGFAAWGVGLFLLWRAFLAVTRHFWPEQPEQRE